MISFLSVQVSVLTQKEKEIGNSCHSNRLSQGSGMLSVPGLSQSLERMFVDVRCLVYIDGF
jgi:hypothetical protein